MAASESNAQSTAFAIQGLVAAGRNPRNFRRTRTPIEYLKSLQAADGSVRYSRTSAQTPVWVTAQALCGLEAKAYPLRPAPRQRARTAVERRGAAVAETSGAAAADTGAASAPASKSATTRARAKRHRRHARPKPARVSSLGTSDAEIRTRPIAQTTTTTRPGSSKKGDGGSSWPYVFAVLLGLVMLLGIRLAWRRG
jgi:hypothetical protein